jgi:hypothetical protein
LLRTLGIDLAAQDRDTAACLFEWPRHGSSGRWPVNPQFTDGRVSPEHRLRIRAAANYCAR